MRKTGLVRILLDCRTGHAYNADPGHEVQCPSWTLLRALPCCSSWGMSSAAGVLLWIVIFWLNHQDAIQLTALQRKTTVPTVP